MDVTTEPQLWEALERDPFGRMIGLSAPMGRTPCSTPLHRVLAPVDGSPASLAALRVAAGIAGGSADAYLHVLNVQPILGNTRDDDTLMSAGLADTDTARRFLADAGIPYRLTFSAGNAAETILAYVREEQISEIVMGADGAGGVGWALIGSVALDVLEQAKLPVTLVKSGSEAGQSAAGNGDLLVAYDGSAGSSKALHYALEQAARLPDAPRIHLLHVHAVNDGLFSRSTAETRLSERRRALETCDEVLRVLEAARADFEFHVVHGDPVDKILQIAAGEECGRIVMSSRGLGWFAALLERSISWGVLHRTPIPITLVKS